MSSHREIANCNPEQHQKRNRSNRSIPKQVTSNSQNCLTNNAAYNAKRRSKSTKEITSHKLNVFYISFNLLQECSGLNLKLKRALLSSRSVEAQASILQHFSIWLLHGLISKLSSYVSMLIYRWNQNLWLHYCQIDLISKLVNSNYSEVFLPHTVFSLSLFMKFFLQSDFTLFTNVSNAYNLSLQKLLLVRSNSWTKVYFAEVIKQVKTLTVIFNYTLVVFIRIPNPKCQWNASETVCIKTLR